MQSYVLSVILGALCCSMICRISGSTKLVRLVSGIVLGIVVLQPLGLFRGIRLAESDSLDFAPGEAYVEDGERLARQAQALHIQTACEAYILEKAQSLGQQLEVRILLEEDMIPTKAIIRGEVSGKGRTQLEQILENDLGLTKENQRWIGNQEKNG